MSEGDLSEDGRFLAEAANEEEEDGDDRPPLVERSDGSDSDSDSELEEDEDAMIAADNRLMLAEMEEGGGSAAGAGSAETESTEPAKKMKLDPFAEMMTNRPIHKKRDPEDKREKRKKPRGAPPKGKIWDEYGGWVDDPSYVPTPAALAHPVGRPKASKPGDGGVGDDAQNVETAGGQRRLFQPSWKAILPWLIFSVGVGIKIHQMDTEVENMTSFACPIAVLS